MNPAPANRTESGHEALSEALKVSFRLLRYLMLLLLFGYLASGVFVVNQHEKAFVLLYGKVAGIGENRIHGPGLHWTWPRPFTEVVRIPAGRVQTVQSDSFWYFEEDPEHPVPPGPTLVPGRDGYTLTADANLLHSRWTVRYLITDPEAWYFRFRDMDDLVRHALDAAVVAVMAEYPVDEAQRTRIEAVRGAVETRLRATLDGLRAGLRVQGVDLVVRPPRQVQEAFESVTRAENQAAQKVLDAQAYARSTANQAGGEAEKLRLEGESDRAALVARIKADAAYFVNILGQYRRDPQVTLENLRLDAVQRALGQVGEKVFIPPGGAEVRIRTTSPKKKVGDREGSD